MDTYPDIPPPIKAATKGPPPTEVRITNPITGGMKNAKDERFNYINWTFQAEVARVHHFGASKYSPWNWQKGYEWSLSFDALMRHIISFWTGQEHDEETGLHHLAHADWHLGVLHHFHTNPEKYAELDDRGYKP